MLFVALWQIGQPLQAATFYWDTDTSTVGNNTDGTGLGGSGNWDTSTSNWWDLAALGAWPNTNVDQAIFTGPAPTGVPTLSTVTLSSGIIANRLSFLRSGYTLTGGDLTLAGAAPTLHANLGESATIGSQINGTAGLTKTGGGSIRLGNAGNTYTGATSISNGTLIIGDQGALGMDSSPIVVTGSATRGFGGGSLVLEGGYTSGVTVTRNLSLQGLGPISDRGGALVSVGNNTLSGTLNAAVGSVNTRLISAGGVLTMSGTLDVAGTAGTTVTQLGGANNAGSGSYVLTGALTGTGTLEKTGSGTLILTPSSTAGFSGSVRMSTSATGTQSTVRITTANVLGTRTATTTGGVLDLNGGLLEVLMDAPSVLAGGSAANLYGRAGTTTIFADHSVGGSAINGTVTFGQMAFEENTGQTFASRNGYGVTIGAAPVQGGTNVSTITNNLTGGGLLTFTGAFWSNTDTTSRTMTIAGNGNTLISGNFVAAGAAVDHNLTKTGTGTLTLTGTAGTLDGAVNIQAGTVAVSDFRAINLASTSAVNIGATTVAGIFNIIGTAPTAAQLTFGASRALVLIGTTGGATINANQTGANPVLFNNTAAIVSGSGTKTLTLGGTNLANNEIRGIIQDNLTGTNNTSLVKTDAGTWLLSGANTYTGTTTISAGTLKLQANAATTSTVIADAPAVIFTSNATILTAGGTLELVGFSGSATTETLGALTPTAGAATVKLTANTVSPSATNLIFTSLGATTAASSVNFNTTGASGGLVTLTGQAATTATTLPGTANFQGHLYVNGADFAAIDGSANVIAPVYGTTAGFVTAPASLTASSHNLLTGSFTSAAVAISSLKTGSQTLTLSGNLTVNLGAILQTGGTATIQSNSTTARTIVGSAPGVNIAIRVDGASDVLNLGALNAPVNISSTTTAGLTKNGAGTLVINGVNAQTGTTTINEGTVKLGVNSARLSAANVALVIRQGGTLDLNGQSSGVAIGALDGSGFITNSSAAAATLVVGNATTGAGTYAGVIQDGTGVMNVSVTGTTGSPVWSGLNTYTGVTTIGTGLATTAKLVSVPNLANYGTASSIGRGIQTAVNDANNAASLVFGGLATAGINYTGLASVSIDRLFTLNGGFAGAGGQIANASANNSALIFNMTNPIVFGAGATVAQTLTLGGASTGDSRINLQIVDNGALRTSLSKIGAGTWFLGGVANGYTGSTTITAGVLGASSGTTLPANSPLVFGGGQLLTSGNFVRNLVATATPGNTDEVTWTAGGGFAANDAKLVVAIGGLATPSSLTWASGGFVTTGNLILNSANTLSEVEVRNPIDLNGALRTIQVDDNTNTGTDFATITAALSGAGGSLSKAGTGILQLFGANTYGGTTEVIAGTIAVTKLGSSGSAGATSVGDQMTANTNASAIVLGNATTTAGTLQYVGPGETSDRKIRLNGTTANNQIHADGSGPLILTNVAHDTTATGNKTLSLRGSNAAGNMISSVLADNGAGVLGVTVDGSATWILSGANTYSGTTAVNAGALGIAASTLGNGVGNLDFNSGSLFAYGADRTVSNPVRQTNNTTTAFMGDYSLNFSSTLQNLAAANNVGTTNNIVAGKTLTFADVTVNSMTAGRTWTINGTGDTIITGNITTSTLFDLSLVYSGTGSLTLGGTGNDWSGLTGGNLTVSSGTLKLGNSEVLPHGAGNGNLIISPAAGINATLDLNGKTETINGLTANGAGNIFIDNTSGTAASLTFGANDAAVAFAGGAGNYTITDSGAGALSITKTGTASMTIANGATLSYQGTTNVNGGSLSIASAVNGTTGLSATNAATLALTGGITAPAAITSVNVGNGSTLSLLDGVGNKLTSLTSLTLGSAAGTMTTLNLNVGDVTLGDMLNTDTLTLLTSGSLSLFAGNQITLNLTDAGLNAGQTYNLLEFVDGGFTLGALGIGDWLLGATPGGFTSITLNKTNTLISITTGSLITGSSYWNGTTNTTWNVGASNWSTDKAGTTPAASIPGQGTDVIFQSDLATSGAVVTTLEQNFKINSLTFEANVLPAVTPTSVTINPGTLTTNRLEVAPQLPTDGIKITTGGPATVTIAAPVKLGANQTWNVADTASALTLTTGLQGEKDVSKTGSGKVTLSAVADSAFNTGLTADFTISAGTLEITNAGALGTVADSNLANVAVNGGAFYYNNATAGTVANNLTLGGGTLSAGGATQTYSGTVNVSAASFINMRNNNSAVLTDTQRNITLSGVLSGTGKLTVDSINTASAGNQLTGTLTLSNANPTWSGGLDFLRGSVTASNVNALGTGDITASLGRITFATAGGTSFNLAQNFTLDAASGVFELTADASGTPVSDMTVNLNGVVTLGSAGNANMGLRLFQATDNFSVFNITNSVVLGNNASISVAGSTTRPATISGIISDGGLARTLTVNDDQGAWAQTNTILRLTGPNTFTGNVTLSEGVLEFNTVTDIGGAASSLGQGSAITVGTGTLRFIGTASQSTNRPITQTGASVYSANGTGGATITYNGAISGAANGFTLTGAAGSQGFITSGITTTGATDANITGGTWTLTGATSVGDDLVVSGTTTVLNLNSTGALVYNAAASADASLLIRDGAVVNLGANDAVVAADFDRLFLAQDAGGAVATLNMNTFNLTTSRLILGERATDRTGDINGTGTLTVTGGDIDLFKGTINASLASNGTGTFEKFGIGTVTLKGNNSGLASTGVSIVNEGTLVLDYTTDNNTKLRAASQLSMIGSTLQIVGNNAAATSQTVASFTLGSGGSNRIEVTGGTGQEAVLNLGAFTRANGSQDGTIRFVLPSGTQSATNGITTTTALTNGLVGTSGFATVDDGTGVFFATKSGNNIVALASTPKNDITTWLTGDHITDETTGFTGTLAGVSINSLRLNAAGGSDVNLPQAGVLNIASGGLLITSNVTAGTPSITGGTLASGAAEVIVTHDSSQTFEVSSDIRVNHAVTKSGTGTLRLSGNNVYTDETEIQEGTLQVSGGSAIGDTSIVTLATNKNSIFQLLSNETIGRLQGGQRNTNSDFGTVALGANTLTINESASTTYAGFITGSGASSFVMNSGNTGNLNLTNLSSGFTGSVVVSGGLMQLSGIGQINASSFTINKGGNLLLDNNGTTRSGTRILDSASITLNSADGAFSGTTIVRGLAIRTDQNAATNETIGNLNFNSGASYLSGDATGTTGRAAIIAENFVRSNNATVAARARNMGLAAGDRNNFRIGNTANETAFIATLVGDVGVAGTQNIKIVPWAVGEQTAAALADGNMGNSLVTYDVGNGFRALASPLNTTPSSPPQPRTTCVRVSLSISPLWLGKRSTHWSSTTSPQQRSM